MDAARDLEHATRVKVYVDPFMHFTNRDAYCAHIGSIVSNFATSTSYQDDIGHSLLRAYVVGNETPYQTEILRHMRNSTDIWAIIGFSERMNPAWSELGSRIIPVKYSLPTDFNEAIATLQAQLQRIPMRRE